MAGYQTSCMLPTYCVNCNLQDSVSLFYLNPGHLNDIHVCSETIELEVRQNLQYKYL